MDFKISSRFAFVFLCDRRIKLERYFGRYFDKEFQIELRKNIYIYIISCKEKKEDKDDSCIDCTRKITRSEWKYISKVLTIFSLIDFYRNGIKISFLPAGEAFLVIKR